MGDVLEELDSFYFCYHGWNDRRLVLLLIRDKRASFWWIFDETCVLKICWPTMDAETCSLGSNHKDVLWESAQIYPAKHGAIIAPDWQDGELLLQSCQRLRSCVTGGFEIVIKEKRSALVVKAVMRWAVLTPQCRDPRDPPGDPLTAWGESLQTPCGFCARYWFYFKNELVCTWIHTVCSRTPQSKKTWKKNLAWYITMFFLFFSLDLCWPHHTVSIFFIKC